MRAKRVRVLWAAGVAAMVVAAVVATAVATGGGGNFHGNLKGYQEVPAVSTGATGSFAANLSGGGNTIDYTLTYSGLEGDATQAHIHFGQRNVNGGISVWLCDKPGVDPQAPAGTQACPPTAGTISGTIDADDVVGPAAQGIGPREFNELRRAIRRRLAYANVHSTKFPGGEIRAQLRRGG